MKGHLCDLAHHHRTDPLKRLFSMGNSRRIPPFTWRLKQANGLTFTGARTS
jgi:hypothetical protein